MNVERFLGQWTLEDASRIADRLPMIVGGLALLGLVVFLLRAPGNVRRFREYQAEQFARRRTTAARLGLSAHGADPAQPLWRQSLDSVEDGAEKIGAFPRFAGRSKVRILFEGDRDGFAITVLVQSLSEGDFPETPDSVTTMACFRSPDLNLPAFTLVPTTRLPVLAEALLRVVARARTARGNPRGGAACVVSWISVTKYGHVAGDAVLRQLASAIKSKLRQQDRTERPGAKMHRRADGRC